MRKTVKVCKPQNLLYANILDCFIPRNHRNIVYLIEFNNFPGCPIPYHPSPISYPLSPIPYHPSHLIPSPYEIHQKVQKSLTLAF